MIFNTQDQLRHMPDGRNAVHFVTEQLNSLLAPPGESLESTAANDDNSAIEAEYSYGNSTICSYISTVYR